MAIENLLSSSGEWLRGEGPHHQIVVSSRVRLARNLRNFSFPGWAKKSERLQILEAIKSKVEELTEMQEAFSVHSQDLTALEKQVLVERHLISREHAAKGVGSAVIMNKKQTLSIMINEEDHLRMQSLRSGLQLKSVFQVSNQTTLGEKEEEIIERLNKVILNIIQHEQNARQTLNEKKATTLLDHIGRGYGILRYAHSMNSKEALNLLSFMKLGIDLGFFPGEWQMPIDELFMETQPAHLQKGSQQKLAAEERDALRAQIVREKLRDFPVPDVSKAEPGGSEPAS